MNPVIVRKEPQLSNRIKVEHTSHEAVVAGFGGSVRLHPDDGPWLIGVDPDLSIRIPNSHCVEKNSTI